MTFARKINKIPEFYMIFARKMPEFFIIITQKIFPPPCPHLLRLWLQVKIKRLKVRIALHRNSASELLDVTCHM